MKRLIAKYIFWHMLILMVANAIWVCGGCWWLHTALVKRFAAYSLPVAHSLSECSFSRVNRQQIRSRLGVFNREPRIVMSAVADAQLKKIYVRGFQKRESIIWPFYLKYPVVAEGRTVAWLKVWPAPEFVFQMLAGREHRAGVALYFLSWWLAVLGIVFWYFWRHLFVPLGKVLAFVDDFEKEPYPALQLGQDGVWRDLSLKLNRLGDKMYDMQGTLKILFTVSQTLTSHLEVNELFNLVLEIIRTRFHDAPCAVFLPNDNGFLKIRNQFGLSPDFVHALHLRPGEGLAGQSYEKCQTIVLDDITGAGELVTRTALEMEGIVSLVHLPLMVETECVGLLSVFSREKNYFTKERVDTLATLAKYLSIGLRNTQLYERVQELNRRLETEVTSTTQELMQTNTRLIQKVREMKALSDIAASTGRSAGLAQILEMVVEKMKELLNAQAGGFFLYAPETGEVTPASPFFGVKDGEFSRLRFSPSESAVFSSVLCEGKQFVANTPEEASASVPLLSNLLPLHSLALVPLRAGTKNVGVLGVANKFGAPFDQDDVRILELVADRVSGIIENVRLYQELERRLHDMTVLQEISSSISSEPVWEKTLEKVIAATTKAFEADLCALLFYDTKTNELVTQPGAFFTGGDEAVLLRIPSGDENSLSAQVFRSGEAFLSPDASIDPRIKSQTARLWDVKSLILVPLRSENRVIGVLRIGRHDANSYGGDDLRLAELIAHQAATIIENAHLYDSLRDAKGELERLNQIKNEFISMVSHELRTPLTAVKGFVKIVLQGEAGKLNEDQEKFLLIADQSIDRLTILISDLLDISRIESGQFSLRLDSIDPKSVIREVVRSIAPEAARKKLHLKAHIPDRFPQILADRERLIQVFNNLILNSIKFTPEDGQIRISAQDKGDFILFSVLDTGIGIEQADREKVFEKFYQADSGSTRAKSGTGLGLAIAKSIVEMHGGQIWVESTPGQGSNFQFIIPRAKLEIQDFRREQGELRLEGTDSASGS